MYDPCDVDKSQLDANEQLLSFI